MLIGIPRMISPQLMRILMEMGHGDELVIADANFPAYAIARSCASGEVTHCEGCGTAELLDAVLQLLPLDYAVPEPILWHTERHELCHPAHLIAENAEMAQAMTENIEAADCPADLEVAEKQAAVDVVAQREEALAKQLAEMKHRKRKLVDPLQFEMSIQAEDLSSYVPAFGFEMGPPSERQVQALEKLGIFPDEIDNAGKAAKLLDRLDKRRTEGLTTPKQIRFLEGKGFQHVGTWQFEDVRKLIDRIAGNGWKVPLGIRPGEYRPVTHGDQMMPEMAGWG